MNTYDGVDRELVDLMQSVFAAHRSSRHEAPGAIGMDLKLWRTLESLGLTRLTGAEKNNGSGATWREAATLLNAAAGHAASLPLAEHDVLAGWLLELAGLPADDAVRTACILDEAGTAHAVPWAREAAQIVVLWNADDGWMVADIPTSEVAIVAGHNVAGETRDTVTADLTTLHGAAVSSRTADEFFLRGALARTLQTCGAMETVLRLCVSHTTERVQFGRTLSKFQAVQNLVADIAAELSLAKSAASAAVVEVATSGWGSETLAFAIATAKSCAGHAASVVVRNAHQIHGAIGTTFEHELHEFTKRVLAWRSEFGGVHHWEALLTKAALDAGHDGCWTLVSKGGVLPAPGA
ncbi:MAG: acyl-CoA dehydrogenase family protein [Haloechinothrix sp.]